MTSSARQMKVTTVVKPVDLDEEWRLLAVCRQPDQDPDLWFEDNTVDQMIAARLCAQCPARSGCLQHALDYQEPWGVWGGLTPRERDRVERRRAPLPKVQI